MKVTYYLEVVSSWCFWAEPMWMELKKRYEGRADFEWKIALMRPEDFPVSRAQCDWFYQRSGTIMRSPFKLNSGWLQPELAGDYRAPNLVAEAGRDFGFNDDRLRLALTHAAVREGRTIGTLDVAVEAAAAATGLEPSSLRSRAQSPEVAKRVSDSTAEFLSHRISLRPSFILENGISDKVIISGLVRIEPLSAAIDAMISDCAAYATHRAHFGNPPGT